MGSIPPELKPNHIPKTISCFLEELTTIGSVSDRLLRLDDFVKRLEEERTKIDAFKRELPLCMLLLNDAIVTLKAESMQFRTRNIEPVLEEFIPLKNNCDDQDEKMEPKKEKDSRDKMNWMSSVQLWNTDDNNRNMDSNYDSKQNSKEAEKKCCDGKNSTGLRSFMPVKGCSFFPAMETRKEEEAESPAAGLSLLMPGIKNPREEVSSIGLNCRTSCSRKVSTSAPNGQSNLRGGPQPPPHQQTGRKQRRCWSPDLHRRFVGALQQLGGSQVATPKQIRELMQVDGLTNDEVKSHLQKYRLHTRRFPGTTTSPANQSPVILGDLWTSQDQYDESSKQSSSQSESPQGPLQLGGTSGGTSTTGGDSMEEEDDERSENYSWRSQVHKSVKEDG
ncbi:Myb family transcription factor EFM [Camellia lanceoleosa]|uniref:Myb family transcription factor EFM n=1 Tax=Camellia lanceoleosa TaxID=1840588 RepID=A0ACC0HLM9_9ERIC|nr:Myb family transcription factor EFM [Camellia lanceoleosa]